MEKRYICVDLKCFYASVECAARGLDPHHTDLVVADRERGEHTVCLAISPHMKRLGVKNRCRLCEIPPSVSYLAVKPRMKLYMQVAADIYALYLRYVAKEDLHVYSIDEAFLDAAPYLRMYRCSAQQLAAAIIRDIREAFGIGAAAGIGTNLYLAKIALDLRAKASPSAIAFLDEEGYRKKLWRHRPLRDFWQIGRGIEKRLLKYGVTTMEELVQVPATLLYKEFGVHAGVLLDHAWGREETTIGEIRSYRPQSRSLSSHQILPHAYSCTEALLVVKEMTEQLALELFEKQLVCRRLVLSVSSGYEEALTDRKARTLERVTASCSLLRKEAEALYAACSGSFSSIRSIAVSLEDVRRSEAESYTLFDDVLFLEREKKLQHALVDIKKRFGKNAVLKGMNVMEKATMKERNLLIGGHHAG